MRSTRLHQPLQLPPPTSLSLTQLFMFSLLVLGALEAAYGLNASDRGLTGSYTKFVVSIRTAKPTTLFGDNHFCVGSIITMRTVLTAAHCVVDRHNFALSPRSLSVVAGAPNRSHYDGNTTVEQQVAAILPHELFRHRGAHDIALLRLLAAFPNHNAAIQPASLSTVCSASPGQLCTVVGWGQLAVRSPYTVNAIHIGLTLYNQSYCQRLYGKRFVAATMLCTGTAAPHGKNVTLCRGISGAPLFCGDTGEVFGIVSWGVRCDQGSMPTVFTALQPYKHWIAARSNGAIAVSIAIHVVLGRWYFRFTWPIKLNDF